VQITQALFASAGEKVVEPSSTERKLAAILSVDVYGYSRLMALDEVDTFQRLTNCREIMFKAIRDHRGKVANTAGDAVLAEFGSVKDAVDAAIEI
jgi:adenylate cyclase